MQAPHRQTPLRAGGGAPAHLESGVPVGRARKTGRISKTHVEEFEIGPYRAVLTRKDIRHVYLRIDDVEGPLRISAPMRTALRDIERFVLERSVWIERRRSLLRGSTPASPKRGHIGPDATVLLWGKALPLNAVCPQAAALGSLDGTDAEDMLKRELRKRLAEVAEPLVKKYEPLMGVAVRELRYRDMQTRWGSCNVREHRVWLAVSLAHFPPECTELIVVHELSHLIEPSHGPRFKACMGRYLPDWRSREALLKEHARGQ